MRHTFALLYKDLEKLEVRKANLPTFIGCLFTRPGFLAIFLFRLSSHFVHKGMIGRVMAKILWRLNVLVSACDLEPLATVGGGLHIPHPMGIVMGRVTIGENVKILQHVTLGMRRFSDEYTDTRNYPAIGNNVIISVGAVITGGINVGNQVIIGANAVLMQDVPDNALAVGIPAKIILKK